MRRFIVFLLMLFLPVLSSKAQEKKLFQGFDGGMMVHTGFVNGKIGPDAIPAKGIPFGLGGVARLHLGSHVRVGGEGYLSTLRQNRNGSYIKYGWGGLLFDAYTVIGRFQPYAGLTVGGGAATILLMEASPQTAWSPIDGTIYHKQGFLALTPFLGCDFIVGKAMHLTLKADWLNCLGKGVSLPSGPRVYLGFLFYH